MTLRQVHLEYSDGNINLHLKTWVKDDPEIKVGARLELKDDPILWTVVEVFDTIDSVNINRNWGLNLPPSQRTER